MRQVIQSLDTGATSLIDVPAPGVARGSLLIATRCSLISAGTERMLVGFGKASLLDKVRQQPEKVREVIGKIRTDGLLSTIEAVRSKLGQPLPLGYSNVGEVIAVGAEVAGFRTGDRVVSNGPHAEIVHIPANLCARVPDAVDDEAASFTVLASIGLQGIRLAAPTLGEAFVVTGAGLIGLVTVQLLIAQGCRVMAIDLDESKLAIARSLGAETCNPSDGRDPVSAGIAFSRGRGVDGVIVTASTKSSDPITQAAQMSRKRGRIVLVGVTGLELNRADFYEKELTFQVSCSYGPGRYDARYEQEGIDYPFGFVRWTEQRNFEAILDMFAGSRLSVDQLVSHRFPFTQAQKAYEVLTEDKAALGILLQYPTSIDERISRTIEIVAPNPLGAEQPRLGVVGAGNYATRVLIPALKKAGGHLHSIASSGGLSGAIAAGKAGFSKTTSDVGTMLEDDDVDAIVIATRHDSHAGLAEKALLAGKHVFVEKPLGLTIGEIDRVEAAFANAPIQLMVGFNRRFAPHVVKMKALLNGLSGPKSFSMLMNAGAIPKEHWTQDAVQGGGRIIGEACHLIDLMRYLAGSPITSVQARRIEQAGAVTEDKASITLGFEDGSFGTILYLANGARSFPKERIEVFASGRTLQLDNFRLMRGFDWPGFSSMRLLRQDKGQAACAAAFLDAIATGRAAIPSEEIFEVARVTIRAAELLRNQ